MVLALGEETVVQAVVGSIFWAFRRLKKPRRREMSARGYALYSVCPQLSLLSFFPLTTLAFRKRNRNLEKNKNLELFFMETVRKVSCSYLFISLHSVAKSLFVDPNYRWLCTYEQRGHLL